MSKPSCFIIMPLTTPAQHVEDYKGDTQHFIHVLDHLFKPAIESAGLNPIAPISKGSEVIHGDIIRNLETAELVLCDMSILNPNVFFELGIRTALNKSVAMVRDNLTVRVPFDTTIINYHEYKCGLEPWTLQQEIDNLKSHLEFCMENGDTNSLWGYFSMSQQAEVSNDAPEVEKQLGYLIKQVESMRTGSGRNGEHFNTVVVSGMERDHIRQGITEILMNSRIRYVVPPHYTGGTLEIHTDKKIPVIETQKIGMLVEPFGVNKVVFRDKEKLYSVFNNHETFLV